jgi:hypothetical protein
MKGIEAIDIGIINNLLYTYPMPGYKIQALARTKLDK